MLGACRILRSSNKHAQPSLTFSSLVLAMATTRAGAFGTV